MALGRGKNINRDRESDHSAIRIRSPRSEEANPDQTRLTPKRKKEHFREATPYPSKGKIDKSKTSQSGVFGGSVEKDETKEKLSGFSVSALPHRVNPF